MKKMLMVLVLVAILTTGTVFADSFGIGVHTGVGGVGGGGGVNLAFSDLYIYIDALGIGNSMHIAGAVDFMSLFGAGLAPTLDFYIRFGIGASLWGLNDTLGLAASARLPIGLSWRPISLLEIFFQIVPQIGLQVLPDIGFASNFWGGNLGIRLWL